MKGFALTLTMLLLIGCKDDEVPADDSAAPTDDSGVETVDADGDGYAVEEDCDDADPEVNPGAQELCDGVDNDCDQLIDDADDSVSGQGSWYLDSDGDGYGVDSSEQLACAAPSGTVAQGGDCDDADETLSPGADETCDGFDNDCDGAVDDADDDVTDASVWYTDSDFDGYGDPNSPIVACTGPSGAVDNDLDCDDSEFEVNPDMSEICDGVDNDCDPSTSEAGMVRYYTDDGLDSEYGEEFSTATAASPYTLTLSRDGTLFICEGSYYAHLDINADVRVLGTSGSALTTLDGGGSGSVVLVDVGGATVSVEGLTIRGGGGSGSYFGYPMGGGIRCDGSSDMALDDLVMEGNEAGLGGAVYSDGCNISVANSRFEGNEGLLLGGAIAALDTELSLEACELRDNHSDAGGGIGAGQGSLVDLVDTLIVGNSATTLGGGLYQEAATTTCSGSASLDAGFLGNTAVRGGGVFLNGSASHFHATSCDMGSGADENNPDDVDSSDGGSYADFGADESFTCNGSSGCN
ncbi:MAG: putative metal-binding motif-containing protein [Alphaproteobacteria bacterium]|nr:putative metal-binding motif-containing protein [Alphaproteobacteria bacterium]MCB9792035.1 putative metal-binding motif-containing protein [Alphaproteobacteria bacterium]